MLIFVRQILFADLTILELFKIIGLTEFKIILK